MEALHTNENRNGITEIQLRSLPMLPIQCRKERLKKEIKPYINVKAALYARASYCHASGWKEGAAVTHGHNQLDLTP